MEIDEEEVTAEATIAESSRKALLEVLGLERRNRILAALYLVRQDGVSVVRQSSIQIWKALVHNTPRTGEVTSFALKDHFSHPLAVREILPEIITQIISLISSDEFEQQEARVFLYSSRFPSNLFDRLPVEPWLNCVVNLGKGFWVKSCPF